jgi:hypothetical protein
MKTAPALETSTSHSFTAGAMRLVSAFSLRVPRISSAISARRANPVALQLVRGQVHRLERIDGVREIQVLAGVLWLTTTPAEGDVLLRAGDRFSASTGWPVVFEAVQDASIMLLRD